ncbi:MAG TPA: hypothetical protein VMU76_05735 [Acidimicrobiales bacterium]|nr:hypothetical protein [Acidimicrobiales bacterium]
MPPFGHPGKVRVWRRGRARRDSELVGDCEAFLAGYLAERKGAAASVPVWAWTNLLAHGAEEDLRSDRETSPTRRVGSCGEWHDARSYLAAELLDLADTYGPLDEVQRAVMVPLELELASSDEVARWGPRQLVANVLAALGTHRRACRRAVTREGRPPRSLPL